MKHIFIFIIHTIIVVLIIVWVVIAFVICMPVWVIVVIFTFNLQKANAVCNRILDFLFGRQ